MDYFNEMPETVTLDKKCETQITWYLPEMYFNIKSQVELRKKKMEKDIPA